MKITQKLEQAKKEKRTWWSFEYFPPRTAQVRRSVESHSASRPNGSEQGLQNLVDRIERMRLLGPEFIDITWCAVHAPACMRAKLVFTRSQAFWRTYL